MVNFNELLSCCIPLSPVHGEPLMFNFRDPLFFYIPQGHPFMESLLDNKALLYSLMASGGFVLCMITGSVPEINQQFEIVSFPPKVKVSS